MMKKYSLTSFWFNAFFVSPDTTVFQNILHNIRGTFVVGAVINPLVQHILSSSGWGHSLAWMGLIMYLYMYLVSNFNVILLCTCWMKLYIQVRILISLLCSDWPQNICSMGFYAYIHWKMKIMIFFMNLWYRCFL